MRASVKKGDVFESIGLELGQRVALSPYFAVETRWFSTFKMLCNALIVRVVLDAVDNRAPEFRKLIISVVDLDKAKMIQDFLQLAENVTNAQSGSSYWSLSISMLAFQNLVKICVRQ